MGSLFVLWPYFSDEFKKIVILHIIYLLVCFKGGNNILQFVHPNQYPEVSCLWGCYFDIGFLLLKIPFKSVPSNSYLKIIIFVPLFFHSFILKKIKGKKRFSAICSGVVLSVRDMWWARRHNAFSNELIVQWRRSDN